MVVYTVPILLGNIETKTRGIKILKFPIRYCGMNFKEGWINRNLTKNINYTQTDNSVLVICNDYNHKIEEALFTQNWSLTDKAHNFGQEQLIFNKYFNLDLNPLCRRRERAQNTYLHPSTGQNSHFV